LEMMEKKQQTREKAPWAFQFVLGTS
jgi:hypothetical protein